MPNTQTAQTTQTNKYQTLTSSSPHEYEESDMPKRTICTKIGENGDTFTISVNTEESHKATQSGTHKNTNPFHD